MQNKIVNSPELIWLVYGDLDGLGDVDHHKCHEVTWCQDKINQTDIEYVRADKIAELQADNQRMFVALHEDCCKDFVNCNKGCEHLVKQLRADIASRQSCERSMRAAIELALEQLEEPPEANCSCHISPPCSDCVDYSGSREAFDMLRSVLTTRHEVMNPPESAAMGSEARNLNSANVMGLGEVHRASEARPANDVPAPIRIATLQKELRQIENHCHSYKLVADGSYEQCIYEMGHSQKTKELKALQDSAQPLPGEPT